MKKVCAMVFALVLLVCICPVAAQAVDLQGFQLDDPSLFSTKEEYINASDEKILAYLDLEEKPDWMKVLLIHDFVCAYVEYDHDRNYGQTDYNTLYYGTTRCSGYSKFTKRLMDKAGLNCRYVTSEILYHAWNVVKLEDKWYNLDVTWDDGTIYGTGYEFFLKSDAEFGHGRGTFPSRDYTGYYGVEISKSSFKCGHFGTDLYWLVSEEGELTFYGNGDTISEGCIGSCYVQRAVVPETITTIGQEYVDDYIGFGGFDNMTEIILPVSLSYIGTNSFAGCDDLTDVYYAGSEAQWNAIEVLSGNEDLLNARIHFGILTEDWGTQSGSCGENLTWTLTGDRVLRISGSGAMYDYAEGEAHWHQYGDFIYDVVLEAGITRIGSYAFEDCSRIVGLELPDSVTSIGDYALSDCINLRQFTIPDTVSSVGIGVFAGCKRMHTIDLTGNIGQLSDYMFQGCAHLKWVSIPEGITSIGNYCFYECSTFSAKSLPESLTSIGEYAFAHCTVLSELITTPNVTEIAAGTFYGCTNLTQVDIPEYITAIGDAAFAGCSGISSVSFSGNPISTGENAFRSCTWLTKVDLNGATDIGNGCFSYCARLKEIVIPECVASIGDKAFANCNELKFVEIPGSVKSIGDNAFEYCKALKTITLNDGLLSIGAEAFTYSELIEITIPDSVVSIGASAFASCWDLERVTLSKNLRELGQGAFFGCNSLKQITVPGTVENLGPGMFNGCSELETVVLEDGIVSIGASAFMSCRNLTNIEMPDTLTTIGKSAFYSCSKLKSMEIPAGVGSIGMHAFQQCSPTEIFYGGTAGSWSYIQMDYGNDNLAYGPVQYAEVLEGREGVCNDSVFWDLTTDGNLIIYGTGSIEYCGWSAYCEEITSVKILPGVTAIGGYVMRDLPNLVAVQLPDTLTAIDSFAGCTSLAEIDIPDSVTELEMCVFNGCTSLKDVKLPAGLTEIPEAAFLECSGLETITVPEGMESIGDMAFWGCEKLEHVVLPATVTAIGENAFGETSLTELYYSGMERDWTQVSVAEGNEDLLNAGASYHWGNHIEAVRNENIVCATCLTDGSYDRVIFCEICGEELSRETVTVQSMEHCLGKQYVYAEATCQQAGAFHKDCKRCDYYESYEIEQTNHIVRAVETDPTCEEWGVVAYYCDMCNGVFVDEYLEPMGHMYGVSGITEPTCEQSGYYTFTCFRCEDSYDAGTLEPLGHSFVDGVCHCGEKAPEDPEPTEPTEPEETKPQEPTEPEKPTEPVEPEKPVEPVPTVEFKDVPKNAWYADAVNWAVGKGVTNGIAEGLFGPDQNCTRAQVVTFLWRAAGSPEPTSSRNPFKDVNAEDWYGKAVLWAVEKGITNGMTATTFGTDETCTRAQVCTFLWRAQGKPAAASKNPFKDVKKGEYYYDAVLWAVENGVTNGMSEGAFAPDATCTRGQIVTFLYRALA